MTDDRKKGGWKAKSFVFICLLSSVFCPLAIAEEISVNKAEVRKGDDGYHLAVSYDIKLTQVMRQALSRGIPLYFVGEFSLTRPRWYWLNNEVFHGELTLKLSYNVLTRQYRISRGTLFQSFASLEDALNILSRQTSAAISPAAFEQEEGYVSYIPEWVKPGERYIAAVRLRLDNSQLPKLLQMNALSGSDWTLDSDWHSWEVRPAELIKSDAVEAGP